MSENSQETANQLVLLDAEASKPAWFADSSARHKRSQHLDSTYGPGAAEWFWKTLAEQGGRCAVDGCPEDRLAELVLDHNHKLSAGGRNPESWRRILCRKHNSAFGLFGENPVGFVSAAILAREYDLTPLLGAMKAMDFCGMFAAVRALDESEKRLFAFMDAAERWLGFEFYEKPTAAEIAAEAAKKAWYGARLREALAANRRPDEVH